MIKEILSALRWSISIGAKFSRIVPGTTALVVLLTLLSQVSALLGFFLPLKVIILLGSDGVPRYFSSIFDNYSRDELIVSLSIAAVGFYLLHLIAERGINYASDQGTKALLLHGQKIILFEHQDDVAETGYKRYSQALASFVFIMLAFSALMFMYPKLAILITAYLAVTTTSLIAVNTIFPKVRNLFHEWMISVITITGAIGFLLTFVFLVADYLMWSPPGLIIALISLLLSRQIYNHAGGLIKILESLYSQRIKLNALFFHYQVLLPSDNKSGGDIWTLLAKGSREKWLYPVLNELTDIKIEKSYTYWQQSGIQNIIAFRVTPDPDLEKSYLIKLFNNNRGSHALHEATFFAEMSTALLPAPAFIGATRVGKYYCHVFEWPNPRRVAKRKVKALQQDLMGSLMSLVPPARLMQRYSRSRPFLWQRFDNLAADRLSLAINTRKDRQAFKEFNYRLPWIREILQNLPLTFLNPDINENTIFRGVDKRPLLTHWGRWSLDPIGASWPVTSDYINKLNTTISLAAVRHNALADIIPSQARLSALMYALERECKRQLYVDGLALLPQILSVLEEIDESSPNDTRVRYVGGSE